MTIETLTILLRSRLSGKVNNEDALQRAVETILTEGRFGFEREHHFDRANRIDFFLPGFDIGIECKTKASAGDTMRQLARYEPHCPGGLILVATRPTAVRNFLTVPFKIVHPTFW